MQVNQRLEINSPDRLNAYDIASVPPTHRFTDILMSINYESFFIQANLPVNADEAIVIWLRISLANSLKAAALNNQNKEDSIEGWGAIANLILIDDKPCGLFSLARYRFSRGMSRPSIVEIIDEASPFPGLGLRSLKHRQISAPLLTLRDEYSSGLRLEEEGDLSGAARSYFAAARLDHPEALSRLFQVQGSAARPFRERYHEAFEEINHGDRLCALTVIRHAAQFHPLVGNAVLAFCLRGAGFAQEGLAACRTSLDLDNTQADVYGHKWGFLTELGHDEAAREVATDHMSRFPQDSAANINLIDSLLLCGEFRRALTFAERYAIFSNNIELTLRQFFKVYEALDDWPRLLERYEELIPLVHGPSADTLWRYGEVLIETSRLAESLAVFERALAAEPNNARVVLGFARALARAGDEAGAESFITTVLADRNRIDRLEDRAFLVTMLAEIQRRTGRPAEALATFESKLGGDIVALSDRIGPMPAIELTQALLELGRKTSAKKIVNDLKILWPQEELVKELERQLG